METKVILSAHEPQREPDTALIKTIVRGHRWFTMLSSGQKSSINQIADSEGLSSSIIGVYINFAFLAPDIVQAIFEGNQPIELTAKQLKKQAGNLAMDWDEQCRMLVFS